ncbi:MAG: hypothetical protein ABSG97_06655 [Sedimentisphaerales bacterium]
MKDEYITFFWKTCRVLTIMFVIGSMTLGIVDTFVVKIMSPTINVIYSIVAIFITILIGVRYFAELRIWWKRPKGSRKGGVAKVIPDELVPKLEQMFRNAGMNVISMSLQFRGGDEFNIPKFHFICSIPDSDKVVVYFIRYKLCLEKLVICLQPTVSKWWKLRPDTKTLDKIRSILEENGATDIPPYLWK